MTFRLDPKAIGYGFATFTAGTLLMTIIGTVVGTLEGPHLGKYPLALIKLIGYLAPVVAGYVAAYRAPTQRIFHGTIGGSIGALLLLAPALFVPRYPLWQIPILLACYAALASLGAIFGKHRIDKVGP
jgi:hypothetical protein